MVYTQEKVLKSYKYVNVNDLPMTSRAAQFHNLTSSLSNSNVDGKTGHLDAKKWGWEQLMPVKTDMPPAPKYLLRVFR